VTTRIIGCGNRHRGDDAAGVLVAERLRELGVPAEVQSGGAFELVESWNSNEDVILIDAVVTGCAPGTVHIWDGCPTRVPSNPQVSSHGFGVAEAINLARALDLLPGRMRVYGVEGEEFGIGEGVSPEVMTAVEEVAQRIAGEVRNGDIVSSERSALEPVA
jgi:hydrogenase maturation protease